MHNEENQMASTSMCHSYSCFNTIVKNQCGQKLQNYRKLTTSHGLMSRVLGTSVPNPILDVYVTHLRYTRILLFKIIHVKINA